MLLPVGAAFGSSRVALAIPLAARPVEFALTAFSSVAVTVPARPVELRTLSAVELRPLAEWPVAARLEVPLLATLTIKPRWAWPVARLAIGEAPLGAAFAALATRRAIAVEFRTVATLEFRAISARFEIPLLAAGAVVPVEACRA